MFFGEDKILKNTCDLLDIFHHYESEINVKSEELPRFKPIRTEESLLSLTKKINIINKEILAF